MTKAYVIRVLIKGLLLLFLFNLLFAVLNPMPTLGKITAYNWLFPPRQRLPFGDEPSKAYSLNLYQLDAMFASHEISARPKPADEYRILIIGDSSVWGYLLKPSETLSAYTNYAQLSSKEGKTVRAYNLGYPTVSLMKDLLILSYSMRYQPDMVVWFVTLEGLPYDKQLASPIVQNNAETVRYLLRKYALRFDENDPQLQYATFWEKTIIGQRRELANLIRLQLYGVLWAATGVDQAYPETITQRQKDLDADISFHGLHSPMREEDLSFDVIKAGISMVGGIPLILVNEPIFISEGINSNLRYDAMYPRWAYDEYRALLQQMCKKNAWHCIDLWDAIPPAEFTNTAIHITPLGSSELAVVPVQFLQLSLDLASKLTEELR